MTAYYNEIDPYAARWLRNLIAKGLIAPGDVDERSITEVQPDELKRYTQCHFFAGIGVWSHALRTAGWPDSRPVWTGSCPCQPFSSAGQRKGKEDERHLWPAFFRLIRECRPPVVFGEQVAGAAGLDWLDSVCLDLESADYAAAAADLCAAGVGAPHIRQRLYWVADANGGRQQERSQQYGGTQRPEQQAPQRLDAGGCREGSGLDNASSDRPQVRDYLHPELQRGGPDEGCVAGGLADAVRLGQQRSREVGRSGDQAQDGDRQVHRVVDAGACGGLADSGLPQRETNGISSRVDPQHDPAWNAGSHGEVDERGRAGAVDSYWRAADWLWCRDGRWRPVRSGSFPLATGVAGRVGRLRAYGNALCAPVATAFVRAYLEL